MVFAPAIVGWFTSDADVASISARGLRIISSGFLFYSSGYVLTQAFNGAGDTWTPTMINIVCLWLGEIPLAYLLAQPLGFGPTGVFSAFPIAFGGMAVLSAVLFRRGRWKTARV
jgi:Na+-driven multidrug efflux pump